MVERIRTQALVPTQHPDLLRVPRSSYRALTDARLEGVEVLRTQKKVFGRLHTVVVTFNQHLLDGQLQGLTANLNKARHKLRQLQQQLQRWREGKIKAGQAPTLEAVQKHVRSMVFVAVCQSDVAGRGASGPPRPGVDLSHGPAGPPPAVPGPFGKTILFTDNADWTEEQIVLAYRSQYHIEDAFRQLKNPHFLGWSPMFHWTDSKIHVHAFYCVVWTNAPLGQAAL